MWIPKTKPGKWNIFIVHPSEVLTDRAAHGDGLLSYRYIRELALRGHHISVACETVDLQEPLPTNVVLHQIPLRSGTSEQMNRLEYVWRMRRLFDRLHRGEPFDLAHQLNPVYTGLSLGLVGVDIPVIFGPYVAHWPADGAQRLKCLARDGISYFQQRFADAVVLSGPTARSRLFAGGKSASQIYTIPFGIDLERFAQLPLPDGAPVILYLGGLSERKGIHILFERFRHGG